ncbi:ABC transporter substrate-binding protein [Methylibium sp.]|uniref:ABC transporter substrate-binding protein n=1 Tax=Methylibium sp. TaxID=2067992 RepID=UPI0017A14266|nr:ABC transporter substrate-binding protein [Methylibium sp.]MBA3589040.1 ABC transporter substrate-binding protein [Methylibium sp.]
MTGPRRIACLSTEAVEVLWRLGAQDRVAGISGYSVYPPEARQQKPKVSGFSTLRMDRLLAVKPDLVIGFSDLQRPLLDQCEAQGLPVLWFDHRDIAGIHAMVGALGELVEERAAATQLRGELQRRQDAVAEAAARLPWRPRVYFEEWDEPMICGIGWVSELIAVAGGTDVFAERSRQGGARERIVTSEEVLAADPQLVIGSWCGKRFVAERVRARPDWQSLDAALAEVKSADILSPGPAAIERGLPRLHQLIAACCAAEQPPAPT